MYKKVLGILSILCIIAGCFTNFSDFFGYALLYIIVVIGSFNFTFILKKKTSQTIPAWFLTTFIYLYIFATLNLLLIGVYSYIIINIFLFLINIIKNLKSNRIENLKNKLFDSSFYIFTFLFFLFALTTKNAGFMVWDEYSFWSIASKNMYYNNSLYITEGSTLYGGGYPPSPTILQYFFCKIIGNYSQGIELFTCIIFGFSLMLPLFKNVSEKDYIKTISLFLCIIFIPAIFISGYFYFTIYADTLLGILIAYILFEYFTSKSDTFLCITLITSLFCLSCTKATGVVLAGIILIILFLYNIFEIKEKIRLKKVNKREVFILLVGILSILIAYASWKLYVKFNIGNLNYGYLNPIKSNSLIDMLKVIYHTFIGTSYNITSTFSTFFSDFFDKGTYTKVPIGLTGSFWISFFIISYIIIYKYLIPTSKKNDYKKIFILIAILSIIYILFIQIAYYLQFSQAEAQIHASIERYIGSLFVFLLILAIGLSYNYSNNKINFIIIPFILLIFTPVSKISNATLSSGIYNYNMQSNLSYPKEFAEFVTKKVDKKRKIYPVHQSKSDTYLMQFRYAMTPIMIPMVDRFSDDENYSFIKIKNYEEWERLLYQEYDYVVVLNSDDYFNSHYSLLFNNNEVKEWSLYKINKNNGKVKLEIIE